jgi:hypothetical protein
LHVSIRQSFFYNIMKERIRAKRLVYTVFFFGNAYQYSTFKLTGYLLGMSVFTTLDIIILFIDINFISFSLGFVAYTDLYLNFWYHSITFCAKTPIFVILNYTLFIFQSNPIRRVYSTLSLTYKPITDFIWSCSPIVQLFILTYFVLTTLKAELLPEWYAEISFAFLFMYLIWFALYKLEQNIFKLAGLILKMEDSMLEDQEHMEAWLKYFINDAYWWSRLLMIFCTFNTMVQATFAFSVAWFIIFYVVVYQIVIPVCSFAMMHNLTVLDPLLTKIVYFFDKYDILFFIF